jgi:hypothetical protein
MNLWLKDPKTGEGSVAVTMVSVSFVAVLIAASLHMAGKITDTSVIMELFYSTAGLYGVRKFTSAKLESTTEGK